MLSGVGDVVRELVEARLQLVRYGVLLHQAVARLNATGEVDGSLLAAAQRCDAATASLRAATERVGRLVWLNYIHGDNVEAHFLKRLQLGPMLSLVPEYIRHDHAGRAIVT